MLCDGKIAVVTGGGRGLGRAHALALAAAGARVVVSDLGGSAQGDGSDAGVAQAVADEIVGAGGTAIADTRSIADWRDAHAVVELAIETFGGIDILVNNAGISRAAAFGDMTERDWSAIIDVNLKGTVATMNAAAAFWRRSAASSGRAIVNTSSPAGTHPVPPISIYSASKAGVLAVTQCAAIELAPLGVRVNAIAPVARTRINDDAPEDVRASLAPAPQFDAYLPDHVSRLVLYLASPSCAFTGRVFAAYGGEVYLYEDWSAEHHVSNGAAPWSTEDLERALGALPRQDRRWIVAPGGRVQTAMPPDEALSAPGR